LLEDETLKLTLAGDERTVDFERIITDGKILLVKLPEGSIGPDAAEFLGGLIVAQLRLAAFRQGSEFLAARGRKHFVYLDEFQRFTTTDIARVVAEARKFGLGFVLANQNLEQLREFSRYAGHSDDSLLAAILGNVGSTIVFKTGTLDSSRMEQHLGLKAGSLARLDRFEAVASVLVDGRDVGPFTLSPKLVSSYANPRNMQRVVELMHKPGGVWRPMADLMVRTAQITVGGSESPRSNAPRIAEDKTDGSFLDSWLEQRRQAEAVSKTLDRPLVPRVPSSKERAAGFPQAIDTWIMNRRGHGVPGDSSERPGAVRP
jgi:hypothetical protein